MSDLADLPEFLPAETLAFKAQGRDRAVYEIAGHPALVAKVILNPSDRTRKVLRHESRFLAERRDPALPIARTLGTRATDHGPAQICQKVTGDDGELARTVMDLLDAGEFTQTHLDALNRFVDEAVRGHIPFSDYSPRNLVYGKRSVDSAPRIIAIDGFGDKSFIQIKRWWRWANTPHLIRKFGRVPRRCGLVWNLKSRRYEFAPPGAA